MMVSVDVSIQLANRGTAKQVSRDRPDGRNGLPWAAGYPMEGDQRSCLAYLRQIGIVGPGGRSSRFGYYQIVLSGQVVGGVSFHGPPRDGVVEVGYGVVPQVRGQGVATEALRQILHLSASYPDVRRVCGRTTPDNVASQRVMLNAGMVPAGRDPEFLHFEIDLEEIR